MNALEAKAYLDSFINYEKDISLLPKQTEEKLKRVDQLFHRLGNLQKAIPTIHIAGSKGKGSTAVLTANILKMAGYRVGLYTSPHLSSFCERIRVLSKTNNKEQEQDVFEGMIKEDELAYLLSQYKNIIDEVHQDQQYGPLSWYEVFTALAWCYFREKQADIIVAETGLGGRWDATNVVDTIVCGITPISLEHTKILGNTLAEIAGEKAAIVKKKNQSVFTAWQEPEAAAVIEKHCKKIGASLCKVGGDIQYNIQQTSFEEQTFSVITPQNHYHNIKLKLLGEHQVQNAALAIGMVDALSMKGFCVDLNAIYQGCQTAVWPGRLEIISHEPFMVVDAAHDSLSFRRLQQAFETFFPKTSVTVIFGISDDKSLKDMIKTVDKFSHRLILTRSNHPRARELKEQDVRPYFQGEVIVTRSVHEALMHAQFAVNDNENILITGSIFLIGEVKEQCINTKVLTTQ